MSDVEFRLRELERRMGRVEDAIASLPVVQRDIAVIAKDVEEGREEARSLRRAFYAFALSLAGSALLFTFTVFELFK